MLAFWQRSHFSPSRSMLVPYLGTSGGKVAWGPKFRPVSSRSHSTRWPQVVSVMGRK